MSRDSKPYEELLRVAIDRMPRKARPRARRDVEELVARAPSIRDVHALAADRTTESSLRAQAIRAIGIVSKRTAKPLLLSIIGENVTDEVILWECGKALVQAGVTGPAVPLLLGMLQDGSVEQRRMAAWTLGMGSVSTAARTALEHTLSLPTEHADVRAQAAEGLGTLTRKASVGVLLDALTDSESKVRFWAAYALGEIGDRRALSALQTLTTDRAKVDGFGTVGSEARSAIDRIMQRTK
jgi:HEAT repeat protein